MIPTIEVTGFFVGWPNPPPDERFRAILMHSDHVWMAIDQHKMVGFVTMITDKVFYGFVPLLEVLPAYQGKGIGSTLITLMKQTGHYLYAIDLVCDDAKVALYERNGFRKSNGMMLRNYQNQCAASTLARPGETATPRFAGTDE